MLRRLSIFIASGKKDTSSITFVYSIAAAIGYAIVLVLVHVFYTPPFHVDAQYAFLSFSRDLSLLQRLFDPYSIDSWRIFRARELSLLLDLIDAEFLRYLLLLEPPRVFSLSIVTLNLLTAVTLFVSIRTFFPKTYFLNVFIPPLVFLSTQNVALYSFVRSAKYLTCFLLILLVVALVSVLRRSQGSLGRIKSIGFILLSFGLALSDEQGVFYLMLLTFLTSLFILLRREWKLFRVLLTMLFSLALYMSYRLYLGPEIVSSLHGYLPVPWDVSVLPLVENPLLLFLRGALITTRYAESLFYENKILLILFLSAVIFCAVYRYKQKEGSFQLFQALSSVFLGGLSFSLISVMHTMMLLQHPSSEFYTHGYYQVPMLGALIFFSMYLLNGYAQHSKRWSQLLLLFNMTLLIHNGYFLFGAIQDTKEDPRRMHLYECLHFRSQALSDFELDTVQREICEYGRGK